VAGHPAGRGERPDRLKPFESRPTGGGPLTPNRTTHLTATTLETYFTAGTVIPVQLATTPNCTLRIDPPADQLELWTPAEGPEPDVTALSRLSVAIETLDGGVWFVLTIDARGAHFEAYSLIAAIVDDLAAGRPFHVATTRSVATYRDLLSGRSRLSEEQAIGMIGELLVLEHLLKTAGEVPAMTSWVGPGAEEHDFALPEVDAEVKTTLGERRSHIISTETQLDASPHRPLWLISIQLTRAGNAPDGFGLADIVGRIQTRLHTAGDAYVGHLRSLGWQDSDAELYRERYLYRTHPAAYLIDGGFPALTRARIDAVVPRAELVGPVSYRVDVSSLTPRTPPGELAAFVGSDPS
jgi:hypothetical protein